MPTPVPTADHTTSVPTSSVTTANPTTNGPTFPPSSLPTTANPTTVSPTTTDLPSSAPNDRTSSMPPTVDLRTSMPSITALPTEQTPTDASAMTSAFVHDLSTMDSTLPDAHANEALVLVIISSVAIVVLVLLIGLCCCILLPRKKRDPQLQARHGQVVNAHRTSNEDANATVSLECIGKIAEGNGNIENDRSDMIIDEDVVNDGNHTRGGGTNDGYGDANEYQNNPNIAEDEFIVRNDEDDALE
eukprot:443650_1